MFEDKNILSTELVTDLAEFIKITKEHNSILILQKNFLKLWTNAQFDQALHLLYNRDEILKLLKSCGVILSEPIDKEKYNILMNTTALKFLDIGLIDKFNSLDNDCLDRLNAIFEKYFDSDEDFFINMDMLNVINNIGVVVIIDHQENIEDFELSVLMIDEDKALIDINKWLVEHVLIKDIDNNQVVPELVY